MTHAQLECYGMLERHHCTAREIHRAMAVEVEEEEEEEEEEIF